MGGISRETMQRQFTVINFLCLAMIGSVFIYAALVTIISKGWIAIELHPLDNNVVLRLKYILLAISLVFYFVIKLIQKMSSKSLKNYFSASIITFALCEGVAVFGLVLFFLSGDSLNFYIFMAISMLFFFIFYPRYDAWENLWLQESSTKTPSG